MSPDPITLIPIDSDGSVPDYSGDLPAITGDVLPATVGLYGRVGFEPPWINFLALVDGAVVGTCGFTSPPVDGRVEIAYFTFPDHEGRGLATAMARELVAISQRHDPSVLVTAHTLPGRNASHRVLEKLGFAYASTLEHPEDGTIWVWQLESAG